MQQIPTKVDGVSTLPAAEFNQIPLEIQNAITSTGQTLSSLDPNQLGKSLASYAVSAQTFVDTGTANAKVLSTVGSYQNPVAYTSGMIVNFVNVTANTGAVTLNVAGLGVKSLVDRWGQTLVANSLLANTFYSAYYNGAVFVLTDGLVGRNINLTADTTLTVAAHANSTIALSNGSSSITATLPALSTVPDGTIFNFTLRFTSPNLVGRIQGNGAEGFGTFTYIDLYIAGSSISIIKTFLGWKVLFQQDGLIGAAQDRPTAQTLSSGTATKIQLNRLVGVIQGTPWTDITTNYRITPKVPGWYLFTSWITFAPNATGDRYAFMSFNSGPGVISATRATASLACNITPSGVRAMNGSTDYVELFGYQDSGGSLDITYGALYATLIGRTY